MPWTSGQLVSGGGGGESDTPGHLALSLPGDLVSWWELGWVHAVLGGWEVGKLVHSLGVQCMARHIVGAP